MEYTSTIDAVSAEQGQTKESIFAYYNVDNEIKFVGDFPNLPDEQKRYYLGENVRTFLGEFALGIRYKTLTYILREDGLYYGDINMLPSYEKTAALPQAGPREAAELDGARKITNYFLDGANVVYSPSPSKIAAYGFMFYYQKSEEYSENLSGYPVTEYILKYDEPLNSVDETKKIVRQIKPDEAGRAHANDFVANPFAKKATNTDNHLSTVLSVLGIGVEEQALSKRLEQETAIQLESWVTQYTETIMNAAKLVKNSFEYTLHVKKAKFLLQAIFNRATDIRTAIVESRIDQYRLGAEEVADVNLLAYYGDKEATVMGGGSCPALDDEEKASPLNVYRNLAEKASPVDAQIHKAEKIFGKEKTCGECGKDSSDSHYHCPGCNGRYEDETHKSERTRTCVKKVKDPKTGAETSCGFKFNC